MVETTRRPFRDSVAAFMLVTCGWSWSLWLTAIASQRGWVSFEFFPGPLGSFGPVLGASILALLNGRNRELWGRMRIRGVAGLFSLRPTLIRGLLMNQDASESIPPCGIDRKM